MMKKKNYLKPTCKAYTIEMPQLLAGSGIDQGGESGGGHGTIPSNSTELEFTAE
jgi:hypothetical protein